MQNYSNFNSSAGTSEPRYRVHSPEGLRPARGNTPLSHFADLNGKTVCELDGRAFRANETLAVIRGLLQARYPGIRFVKAGEIFSPSSQDQAAGLREQSLRTLESELRRHGVDAVITGNGA